MTQLRDFDRPDPGFMLGDLAVAGRGPCHGGGFYQGEFSSLRDCWNHARIRELGRYQLIDGGNDEYCSLLRRLLRGITCDSGYSILLRAAGVVMLMPGPVRSLHCLAANMKFVEKALWPRIVERFQETLDLQESEATVSLEDDRLTLAANARRYEVQILAA